MKIIKFIAALLTTLAAMSVAAIARVSDPDTAAAEWKDHNPPAYVLHCEQAKKDPLLPLCAAAAHDLRKTRGMHDTCDYTALYFYILHHAIENGPYKPNVLGASIRRPLDSSAFDIILAFGEGQSRLAVADIVPRYSRRSSVVRTDKDARAEEKRVSRYLAFLREQVLLAADDLGIPKEELLPSDTRTQTCP